MTENNAKEVIIDNTENESIKIIASLNKSKLNYLEEAIGYNRLIKEYGFTQQQLAQKFGKSQSTIANKIRLLKLPEEIRNKAMEKGLSERHTRALLRLLKLKNNSTIENLIDKISKEELTVKKTEILIKEILENPKSDIEKKSSPKKNVKAMINMRIYLNTIKQAYDMVKNTGIDAEYEEIEKDDCIEVIVKIPKRK